MTPKKLKRVLTVNNLQNQKIKRVPFTGQMQEAFGNPQENRVWFCYGESGSGKSSFAMTLAKAYAEHYKTFYNPLEEGTGDSNFIERTKILNMHEVKDKFHVQMYNYDNLMEYLAQRNSPAVVVIDSALYCFKNYKEYYEMCRVKFPNKTFIITGHAQGKKPKTTLEIDIEFDANQKVFCSGYLAQCKGRTIGINGGKYIIWKEGYEKVRGVIEQSA